MTFSSPLDCNVVIVKLLEFFKETVKTLCNVSVNFKLLPIVLVSKIESVKYFPGVEKYYIVLNLLKNSYFVRFSIVRTFSISNKSPGPLKVRDRKSLL